MSTKYRNSCCQIDARFMWVLNLYSILFLTLRVLLFHTNVMFQINDQNQAELSKGNSNRCRKLLETLDVSLSVWCVWVLNFGYMRLYESPIQSALVCIQRSESCNNHRKGTVSDCQLIHDVETVVMRFGGWFVRVLNLEYILSSISLVCFHSWWSHCLFGINHIFVMDMGLYDCIAYIVSLSHPLKVQLIYFPKEFFFGRIFFLTNRLWSITRDSDWVWSSYSQDPKYSWVLTNHRIWSSNSILS